MTTRPVRAERACPPLAQALERGAHSRPRLSLFPPASPRTSRARAWAGEVKSVQFLGSDVAMMHATGGTIVRGKPNPSPEQDSIQTLVVIKPEGEWPLAAFQDTRVRPMALSKAATLL